MNSRSLLASVLRGGVTDFVDLHASLIVIVPCIRCEKGALPGTVPVKLILIERRVEVIEKRRRSLSAEVKIRGDDNQGDKDQSNGASEELWIRQMKWHSLLLPVGCSRRPHWGTALTQRV